MSCQRMCMSLISLASALCVVGEAHAFSKVVAFGDSLSDSGNLYAKLGGALPQTPYWNGRFSNGPVAVEVLAGSLGLTLDNHAYGGALTGVGNLFAATNPAAANTGISQQVSQYIAQAGSQGGGLDADALYFVWGGGNDFLATLSSGDFSNVGAVSSTAVSNLVNEVDALYEAGARNFFVALMPDMGSSYYGNSGLVSAAYLKGLSLSFNASLSAEMLELYNSKGAMSLTLFDTASAAAGIRADLAIRGANDSDPCWTGNYTGQGNSRPVCGFPQFFYLFDAVHPTAFVHSQLGKAMNTALSASTLPAQVVPEPDAVALAVVGLGVVVAAARRRVKQAAPSLA